MKKNLLIIALFSFVTFPSFSQEEATSSFRLELATQRILPIVSTNEDLLQTTFYRVNRRLYNYSLHLSGFWDLNDRLELGIGAGFSNRDIYLGYACNFCLVPNSGEFLPGGGPFGAGGYLRRRAIEVPVELRFNWFKKETRIDPFVGIGLTNRLPLVYFREDGELKSRLELGNYGLGLSLILGTRWKLSPKWELVTSVAITRNENYLLENDLFIPNLDPESLDMLNEFWIKFAVRRAFGDR